MTDKISREKSEYRDVCMVMEYWKCLEIESAWLDGNAMSCSGQIHNTFPGLKVGRPRPGGDWKRKER